MPRSHPAKNAGPNALDQFIGSQGFIAACRVGTLCLPEMELDEEGRAQATGRMLYVVVRHAYTGDIPTLVFRKEEITVGQQGQGFEMRDIKATHVVWEGTKAITGNEALAAISNKKPSEQHKVQEWLREMLIDGKDVPAKEVEASAKMEGFSGKQIRTAGEKIGVIKWKETGTLQGDWFWRLPEAEGWVNGGRKAPHPYVSFWTGIFYRIRVSRIWDGHLLAFFRCCPLAGGQHHEVCPLQHARSPYFSEDAYKK